MIYLGIIASLLADFIFQTKKRIQHKKENLFKGNLGHAICVLFVYLVTFSYVFIHLHRIKRIYALLIVILLATIIHFIIDLLKSFVLRKSRDNANIDLSMFIIDQVLHILSIIILFSFIHITIPKRYTHFLIIVTLLLTVVFIGDYIVRKTFKAIKLKNYEKRVDEISGVGSVIGKLERAIIFLVFVFGHPEIIIAVIGIKSIARFPEYNQDEKNNDYFILGNLLSLLTAILGYAVYLILINIS